MNINLMLPNRRWIKSVETELTEFLDEGLQKSVNNQRTQDLLLSNKEFSNAKIKIACENSFLP